MPQVQCLLNHQPISTALSARPATTALARFKTKLNAQLGSTSQIQAVQIAFSVLLESIAISKV